MPAYISGFDPIQICQGIINALIKKGVITQSEGQAIVDAAKAP